MIAEGENQALEGVIKSGKMTSNLMTLFHLYFLSRLFAAFSAS